MNERQLKIFYEVASKLNMTTVANDLFISQPAVSQSIKELEKEYGVKFFDRIGKKLYLTGEGETLFTYARRILNLNEECRNLLKEFKEMKTGRIRVGASTTVGIYVLTDLIGKYTKQHKNIDISITIENTKNVADLILENKIDFAFVEGPVHSDEILVKDFCDDELAVIRPINHRWAGSGPIGLKELESERIIMREAGSGTREVFERLLGLHNIKLGNRLEIGNSEAIKKAVEAGLGISCLSKRAIQRELESKRFAEVEIEGIVISRKLHLIHHKDKQLGALSNDFIEFCRQKT